MTHSLDTDVHWEPVEPEDETGLTVDEAYALLAGVGPQTSTAKLPPRENAQPSAKVANNTGR